MTRLMWLALGWGAFALGVIGAFLPILPTTPFMLVAAWAFAKSSPRFHRWLMEHPTFGPPIQDWQRHGAISARAKRIAVGTMFVVLGLSVMLGLGWEVLAVQALAMAGAATFILTRPSGPSGGG